MNIPIQSVHKTLEYFLWALSKDIQDENGVTAFAPGMGEPNLNFAVQTGETKGDLEKIIQDVGKFYDGLHQLWGCMMNPSRDQTDLKAALEKRGYGLMGSYPVLTSSLEHSLHLESLKNFDIREVGEEKMFDWILPLKEAFQATAADALLYKEAHLWALQKKANFRHFVAYVEGMPVSAGTLSLSSHGARLDDIGTKPDFQRSGFGTAVTLYAMRVARELGYSWICLEASDQGAFLYKTMGFKELYRNEIYGRRLDSITSKSE
jgi:ribosomal protein S18 acetylase RimI-like enzyme